MEISGKIIQLLPLQSGEGKNGTWKKQEFILETQEQYPKKVCISIWGEKVDQFNIKEGMASTFSINVESREYNGRWYTDIRAWRMSPVMDENAGVSAGSIPPPVDVSSNDSEGDALPF